MSAEKTRMFAKLKKRIKDEGGSMEGEKSYLSSPFPGHASPIRRSSSAATLPRSFSKEILMSGGDSGMGGTASPSSQSSEDSGMRDDSSREEIVSMLLKRTEQCKKMESKISEYAALIKEKNKTVENLELQLHKHVEETKQKLEALDNDHKIKIAELIQLQKQDLLRKEQEMEEKLNTVIKKNLQLESSLKQEDDFKHKLFQREEEQEEVQGLTIQELAKVKHMLLLAQEELSQCRSDLGSERSRCEEGETALKDAHSQLTALNTTLQHLQTENLRLTEVHTQHLNLVTTLSNEKDLFEKRLDEVNKELTAKMNKLTKLAAHHTDLEDEHKTLQRSSDQHKNKMSKLLSEKEDHIEQLQERTKLLEQRSQDHSLSGDERVKAIEAERDNLEHKLTESRQQLTEIKSTWSDKISHLEEQISHLNCKIVEDNEEMAALQQAEDSMRENFHKQITDLRNKLEDAEKRAVESWELASQKDRHYDKQKHELEVELQKTKLAAVDAETQLRSKISGLESQLLDLETARDHMKNQTEQKIAEVESREQGYLEQQLKLEKQVKELEAEHAKLKMESTERSEHCEKLQHQLQHTNQSEADLSDKVSALEEGTKSLQEKLEEVKLCLKSQQEEGKSCEKEKDELLVRNAELSQQLEGIRQMQLERERQLEAEVRDKGEIIQTLQQGLSDRDTKISHYNKKFEDYESKRSEEQVTTATVGQLQSEITVLQNQLTDKNRALKKQEQTLKDLRITLQRELKVQALPNDDSSELVDSHSPLPSRKFESRGRGTPEPAVLPPRGSSNHSQLIAAGIQSQDDLKLLTGTAGIRQELDKDVNFQYLKHVILKFMLSRESEAMKLVKAIAMLLHFNRDEQELIKQTLEWKMSWFGSRPSLGKGQTSKIIPASY